MYQNRILKEIREAKKSKEFTFAYDEEGLLGESKTAYIKFTIKNDGIYQGQTHLLKIKFVYGGNEMYKFPEHPPNVLFLTPIFHPNISVCGSICLDVLKPEAWSALYNLDAVFNSIIALLDEPNIKSPFNSEAAKLYKENHKDIYKQTCEAFYTNKMRNNIEIQKMLMNINNL